MRPYCSNWSESLPDVRHKGIKRIDLLVIPTTPRRGWCLTHTALGALWQKCPIMPFRQSLAYFVMTCRTSRTFLTNDQLQRALIKVFQHIEEQKHVICVISGDWNQICLTVTLSNQFELISVDKVRQCHCIMGWWTLSDDVRDRRQPISLNPLILPISLFFVRSLFCSKSLAVLHSLLNSKNNTLITYSVSYILLPSDTLDSPAFGTNVFKTTKRLTI